MKTGVLIPTRGDRPQFLKHAFYLLERQLLSIDFVEVVDDKPRSQDKDITWRYRVGCERLVKKGADIIFFWEDDDYYSPSYLLKMYDAWEEEKPAILGVSYSIYYHLKLQKWVKIDHPGRASAMSTMVTKDIINVRWPRDSEPYTDLYLWKTLKGKTVSFPGVEAIGIKHGLGLCGGGGHTKSNWYSNYDEGFKWLGNQVDAYSLEFYRGLYNGKT